jgi:hypothetical protein
VVEPPRPETITVLVIEGITADGRRFRPSDWVERLLDTLSNYGSDRRRQARPHPGPERRVRQVQFLQAQICDGQECLVVDLRLRQANPPAFDFLMEFVRSNGLRHTERSSP